MPTQILYAPPDWEPRSIPDSEVRQCLAKGFRRTAPHLPQNAPESDSLPQNSDVPPEETNQTPQSPANPNLLNVNQATLRQLTDLPLVGTAIAKKVIASRPHNSIEDLQAKVPDVEWLSLESKLSFEG